LKQQDYPGIAIVSEPSRQWMQSLRGQAGRDIWLMGGGDVFRYMLSLGEVDSVSVMVIPVLLGAGVPLMAGLYDQTALKLSAHRVYQSGIVSLSYEIIQSSMG
jgi:dihydrofolate reductase